MSREEDLESITSLESESEQELEPAPIKLKKNVKKTIETKGEPEVQYTKTGRIKKPMSEAQKENLTKARIKARIVRKELKELRDAEKSIKKDDRLIRKLEVEAKILNHNEKKKLLFKNAGYVNEETEKPKKKETKINDEETEEQQIKALEEKLNNLRKGKEDAFKKSKAKEKRIIKEEVEISSAESEIEEEEVIIEKPKLKRREIHAPKMNINPPRAEQANPMARQAKKPPVDDTMRAQLLSLFPNYQF